MLVAFLRMIRLIRVDGRGLKIWDIVKLSAKGEKIVIIFNHPSMFEAFALPALAFPFNLIPRFAFISLPDHRFYWAKWFAFFRPVCVPVPRNKSPRENGEMAISIINTINRKFVTLIGAEGGRTCNGKQFKEKNGKKIRRFERGVDSVLKRTDPIVILAWSSGGDGIMRNEEADYSGTDRRWLPKIRWKGRSFSVRFGQPIRYGEIASEDKLSALEDMLLDLANE
jgi:1-acyl-sn-glycerol-3-phosphate acyltransferase